MTNFSERIPSFLWIPIIIGAIALFIGTIAAFIFGISYVEGFGSLLILVLGWFSFRITGNSEDLKLGGFGVAIVITFFALMGMALDQTGNFIYNKPLEWIFCPADSELMRETIRRGARGGGVSFNQNFACVNESGEVLRSIASYEHFGFRFLQYVLIGYILLGVSRIHSRIKFGQQRNS